MFSVFACDPVFHKLRNIAAARVSQCLIHFTENNGTASSRQRSSTALSTTPWWRPSRPGRRTSPSPASPSTSTASSALTWLMRGRIRAKFSRNNTRWVIMGAQLWWNEVGVYSFGCLSILFARGEKWCCCRVWQLDGNYNKYQDSDSVWPRYQVRSERRKNQAGQTKVCCLHYFFPFEIWYQRSTEAGPKFGDINVFCILKQNSWLNPNSKEYTKPSSLPWRKSGTDLHILCQQSLLPQSISHHI